MLFLLIKFLVPAAKVKRDPGDRGATAVEYGLMVGLIAVVCIVAVTFLGNQVSNIFQGVGTAV